MIFTTTNNVDGHEITEYIRVIAGETVTGINFLKGLRRFLPQLHWRPLRWL